jgi:RNA polymerase sigma-70 factor (ECF subfamily)
VAESADDLVLVSRCQRGEMDAFEELVRRYRQKVFGIALSVLKNEDDANEAAQIAFVRAWQHIRSFRKSAKFSTWLYRIAMNASITAVRQRGNRETLPLNEQIATDENDAGKELVAEQPSPSDNLERRELREEIERALAALSPEHRAVIQLREFEGLDYREIADVMETSLGTVMSRLHYARKRLAKILKEKL